ncbi:MAG TPA: hypothetical protein VF662_15315, partial [Allosphingosinicella sp.]
MQTTHLRIYGSALALAACLAAPGGAWAQTAPQRPAQSSPQGGAQQSQAGEKPTELVVTGTRSEVVGSSDRTSFNIANDLQVQTGTVADALRAVPGVEVDLQ